MAENKKSFVLYVDQKEVFNELSNEDAGQLIKHIFSYVSDENPISENPLVKLSFILIKAQLKRDLVKYEEKKIQWSEAGKASAEKKRLLKELNDRATVSTVVDSVSTVSTVNDNVNVTVNVNDIKKEKEKEYRKFAHLKISFSEVEKIKAQGYLQNQIDGILDSIENYKKNTSYTSLYLTALKWLKKEYPSVVSKSTENIEYNYKFFDIPITEEYNFTPAQIIEFCKQGKYQRL